MPEIKEQQKEQVKIGQTRAMNHTVGQASQDHAKVKEEPQNES